MKYILIVLATLFAEEMFAKDIKVMVIDTGIGNHRLLQPFVQYNNTKDYEDDTGHGTHVAGIIAYGNNHLDDKLCSNVKIYSCRYALKDQDYLALAIKCFKLASEQSMDFINFSASGELSSREEYDAIRNFKGVIVVAAGNNGVDLTKKQIFPASYAFSNSPFPALTNIIPVMNVMRVYDRQVLNRTSNYHPAAVSEVGTDILSTLPDDYHGYMTGTSMAAPQYLHLILKNKCKEMQ